MKININNCTITCKIHGQAEAEFTVSENGTKGVLVCKKCLKASSLEEDLIKEINKGIDEANKTQKKNIFGKISDVFIKKLILTILFLGLVCEDCFAGNINSYAQNLVNSKSYNESQMLENLGKEFYIPCRKVGPHYECTNLKNICYIYPDKGMALFCFTEDEMRQFLINQSE